MLSPDRWHQIQALFHEAADLPSDQRDAFLRDACAGDPALRAEVDAMLEADGTGHGLLDAAPELLATLLPDDDEPEHPRQIGPYRILREIGRGGMGTVYLAERDDVGKRVALKLVRDGVASAGHRQRFLFERNVLARLDHPNIATLLDAGMTEQGTPYFAMEYVEGETIERYCDAHRLTISERLALFQTVCRAVQYAHRNLIVHRDLKPSNILVTDQGHVKLLDFGIAKLVEEDPAEDTQLDAAPLTRTGWRLMTPAYASPEQVRGEPITTASDVYALGVILFQLLTGHRPYHVQGRSPGEVEQVICEAPPLKPSTAAGRNDAHSDGTTHTITPETVSQARRTEPQKLRRLLGGDLDTIVLTALRKEPERRYQSAEHVLDDIRRYLEGRPIVARQDTMGYRVQKFVHRHRAGAAAAAVAVVLMTLVVGFYTFRLARERDRARLEAEKAEQVSAFVLGLFDVSDPYSEAPVRGDTLTARTILGRGVAQAEAELLDQPLVQATMLDQIGQVYEGLGMYAEAERLLEQALALRQDVLGPVHEEVAASLSNLGAVESKRDSLAEAERHHWDALAMRRTLLGETHPHVASSLNRLGLVLRNKGQYAEAEEHFREALAINRAQLGEEHITVAATLNNMASVMRHQGRYAEAESFYRQALAIDRTLLGEEHPHVAGTLNSLALVVQDQGRYAEAETLLRDVLALKKRVLGDDHPSTAISLNDLAIVLGYLGRHADAEALLREALAVRRQALGAEHTDVAQTLHNLAWELNKQGAAVEAERVAEQALTMYRTLLGEAHPYVASSMNILASTLKDQGRDVEAEQLFRATLALRRELYGTRHPNVATSLYNVADLLHEQARYQEAEPFYREALDIDLQVLGDAHPFVALDRGSLGACLTALGQFEEAEVLLLDSQHVLEATYDVQHEHTQRNTARLIDLYEAWGQPAQAAPYQTLLSAEATTP